MLHLYGLVEQRPLEAGSGIGGSPLTAVDCGGVVALASEHDFLEAPPTVETLWEHEAVLEALMQSGPVLPVRFGVRYAEVTPLRREIESRHAELMAAFDRVRGRVEVSVRLMTNQPRFRRPSTRAASDSGTHYLLDRLERRREADRYADRIRHALSPIAVAEHIRLLPHSHTVLASSFLIDAAQLPWFRRRAEDLQRDLPAVAVVCTGPWPPYTFVETTVAQHG